MHIRNMTAVVLAMAALLLSVCGPLTPTPEVLADCFLSFRMVAWQDLNGDGLWDASEPPLEGVEFRLKGTFAQMWGDPYLSDTDGELTIRTWSPGNCVEQDYTITALPTESYVPTTPTSVTFSLAAGDSSYEGQFGFREELVVPPEAQAILDDLNDWHIEEMAKRECPPPEGYADFGEASGWIITHKQQLNELGFDARWNCREMRFEIYAVKSGESTPAPICDCE